MPSNLIIDVGNTRTKAYVFTDALTVSERWVTDAGGFDEIKAQVKGRQDIQSCILSASGKVPEGAEEFLAAEFNYLRLKTETPLPIGNTYRTPNTLGKDRIAAVTGASVLYPGKNCLVIDTGTCITYDLINAAGIYLGGNISPGMRMRLEAMDKFTAALPAVEPEGLDSDCGYSTESAMRAGAVWGWALETEGFIRRFTQKVGEVEVILCGGDASLLQQLLERTSTVRQDILAVGLNKILNHNVEQA